MLKNYLTVALRNMLRHKGYTLINITGLAAGMVCCLLILLYLLHETSYDRFNPLADRIYRVLTDETGETGTAHLASTNTPLAPLLAAEFPEMEYVVRIVPYSVSMSSEHDRLFQEDGFVFADSAFFRMFTFEFMYGDPMTALDEPFSIVLTRETAEKYFGSADVVGKYLTIEKKHLFKVTGVLRGIPSTSSIRFDAVANLTSGGEVVGSWLFEHWYHPPVYTYVLLAQNTSMQDLESRMDGFVAKRLGERFSWRSYRLQPLTEVHLTPDLGNEQVPAVNPLYLYSLAGIAFLILLLAGINFTNLSTARSLARVKEVGLRKVIGAGRGDLMRQFLGESVIYAYFSLLIAFILVEFLLTPFNKLTGKQLDISALGDPLIVFVIILLTLVVGIGAGSYPAFILSGFRPARILRGNTGTTSPIGNAPRLRESLVVIQFAVSIALIASTLAIHSQISFIREKNLGFTKEQLIAVPLRDYTVQENFQTLKNTVLTLPGISWVTVLSNFPWESGFYGFPVKAAHQGKEIETDIRTLLVDHDFVRTMDMQLVAGRDFSIEYSTDARHAFIINETAARRFGFEDPIGISLTMASVAAGKPKQGEVVGVVQDFHFQSLYHAIQPIALTVSPESYYLDNMVVRLSTSQISETISELEGLWRNVVPGRPFEYFFLDHAFDALYREEVRIGGILNASSAFAVMIGCLGLFGLSSYTTRRRMKEICIRKVLGSSAMGIVGLLSKDYIKLVLISNVIAWPAAYYAMNIWLENFAYRIDIGWWTFIIAGSIATIVALSTVGFQAIRAAGANPADALKYE